jgi:lipid II:glycine glycyltransferase (peptidoglycan interpeptide bridge formation enzyme)
MNITCQLLNNKQRWEQFVADHSQANFLQSFNWGLFSQKINKKFFPLALFNGSQQLAAALVIKEEAKRGDYLTLAGGPILDWDDSSAKEIFTALTAELVNLAKQEGCHFVRIRPQTEAGPAIKQLFTEAGLVKSPMHLTADLTLRLDLTQPADQLLTQMRKNTRYEIRKAEKLGIVTQVLTDASFMEEFYQHQLYLAKKHRFVPFDYQFLYQQFVTFAQDDQAAFINSYYQDQLLASAFIIFYQHEAVYHYGISSPLNSRLPGSFMVQWRAIQEAKKRGCTIYNFWGVSPKGDLTHRFAGPSLFKRGFGGYELQHLPAHDLPTSNWYWLIRQFELLRKRVRRL